MTTTIGILLFDRVEELDAVGPWAVLAYAMEARDGDLRVTTIAEHHGTITCNKGLKLIPEHSFADAPALDVLLVPGGNGSRAAAQSETVLAWVRGVAEAASWVTSVCTGARVLLAAGPARGKRLTTYHDAIEELRHGGLAGEVLSGVRYVRDGNVVTSAGVSAGIDMSLWLLGELYSPAFARQVQQGIEYFPAPPYSAEV